MSLPRLKLVHPAPSAAEDAKPDPTRACCRECGLYFQAEDGIPILGYCFACLKSVDPHNPEAMAAYLWPVNPPVDPAQIEQERQLTKMRLALYFLHEALSGTTKAMNPARSAQTALELFQKNFPDLENEYLP